jgi:hypothetical protein
MLYSLQRQLFRMESKCTQFLRDFTKWERSLFKAKLRTDLSQIVHSFLYKNILLYLKKFNKDKILCFIYGMLLMVN